VDAQIRRRRTLEAIKRILLRESLNQPLMVILEDLRWIDEFRMPKMIFWGPLQELDRRN
jgi:predicted ATPase